MEGSGDRCSGSDKYRPDSGRGFRKTDKDQLISTGACILPVINFHPGSFKNKFPFSMGIFRVVWSIECGSSRRTDGNSKHFRGTCPQLQIKAVHFLICINFHFNCVFAVTFPIKMVSGICLISGGSDNAPAPAAADIV